MPTNVNATEIDFDGIVKSIRDHLTDQTNRGVLKDYNYDSSVLGVLINMLGYNTALNATYYNFVTNESFLSSAILRHNIVGRARNIGYVPRSAKCATMVVNVTNNTSDVIDVDDNDSIFSADVGGRTIRFIPRDPIEGLVPGVPREVTLIQGTRLTHTFGAGQEGQDRRYVLPNPMVDRETITVMVGGEDGTSYQKHDTIVNVTPDTPAFFVQENEDGLTEIYFGDGVIGRRPSDDDMVRVRYIVCAGREGNDVGSVTSSSTEFSVSPGSRSEGGDDEEDVESVRLNAPVARRSGGRFVTTDDYHAGMTTEFGDIASLRVWGGEDNDPPDNGAIYLSVVPRSPVDFLSINRQRVMEAFLKRRGVIGIRHVFVRSSNLYVVPTLTVRYDPNLTTRSPGEILSLMVTEAKRYEEENLLAFESSFYFSDFLGRLSRSDQSILGVSGDVDLQRRIVLDSSVGRYNIPYNNPLVTPGMGVRGTVRSTRFDYQFEPNARIDDGDGVLSMYHGVGDHREVLLSNVGRVDYVNGVVVLNGFVSATTEPVRFNARPSINDVFGRRSQVLRIGDMELNLVDRTTNDVVFTTRGFEDVDTVVPDDYNSSLIF